MPITYSQDGTLCGLKQKASTNDEFGEACEYANAADFLLALLAARRCFLLSPASLLSLGDALTACG